MEPTFCRWHLLVAGIACLTVLLTSPHTLADDVGGDNGITVIGDGVVKAKPTEIEITVNVSGEAELAGDARVKFHDAKKKGLAALDALKIPGLSVKSEGPSVSEASNAQVQMRMMQGMPGGDTKSKVQIAEALKIRITGVDKKEPDQVLETVLKVLDACHDAGLQVGPPAATNFVQMQIRAQNGGSDALVNFRVPDKSALENSAYEKAVADARAKAQRLATLNGVKLGRVLSVKDPGAAAAGAGNPRQMWAAIAMGNVADTTGDTDTEGVSSQEPGEIPISAHLAITFEILK